jgi:drug/metabolite transporter (DMT)-like permease
MPDGVPTEEDTSDRTTLAVFLLMVLVAGGNAVVIRSISCATCELDPFWSAATRFLPAALIFAVVARMVHADMPRGRALAGAVLYGVLQFGAGFGLVYWGFVRTPAGRGQVLLACVPLITFGLAVAQRQERFRWEGLVGAALALAGMAFVFGNGLDSGVPTSSMVAIVLGGVCWAEALIVVKGLPPVHPAAMNAVGMGVGSVMLLATSAVAGEAHVVPKVASVWLAQSYLVLAGSVGVFWLFVIVLRRWSASAASYQLVLLPLVTVTLSAWLEDERITWAFAAGSVLVIAGVYFGALRRPSGEPVVAGSPGRASPNER